MFAWPAVANKTHVAKGSEDICRALESSPGMLPTLFPTFTGIVQPPPPYQFKPRVLFHDTDRVVLTCMYGIISHDIRSESDKYCSSHSLYDARYKVTPSGLRDVHALQQDQSKTLQRSKAQPQPMILGCMHNIAKVHKERSPLTHHKTVDVHESSHMGSHVDSHMGSSH